MFARAVPSAFAAVDEWTSKLVEPRGRSNDSFYRVFVISIFSNKSTFATESSIRGVRRLLLREQSPPIDRTEMKTNRVHPSRNKRSRSPSEDSFDSSLTFDREPECCEGACRHYCTQRCVCLSLVCLLGLAAVAVAVALGVVYGVPKITGVNRECQTALNKSGFLCDDRVTCISTTKVCNHQLDCTGGADESQQYCADPVNTLPSSIIFLCGDKKTWTYRDKVCDMYNDCGDCSDETVSQCPVCSGWRCDTVFFQDCDCIPRTRCKNSVQDCIDWSDEIVCL